MNEWMITLSSSAAKITAKPNPIIPIFDASMKLSDKSS
jgi:hypothetical protein